MNVADSLVASLQRMGVTHIFGLPGSTEGPLLDALSRVDTPQYVLGLHENIVTAMADGYARESGDLGVVSLHTSVGAGNAISQLMNANADSSPVLAIVGHKDAAIANRDGFCTIEDLPGLLRPFTKWSRQVEIAGLAVEDLERAAGIAMSAPRGPVALVITEDRARAVLARDERGGGTRTRVVSVAQSRPELDSIAQVVKLLEVSQRPLVIAGDGVSSSSAHFELAAFAEATGAVVLQEPRRSAARINFDTEHPNYCGEYVPEHPAVLEADLIIALGARVFVEFEPTPLPELPVGVPFVHVHEDASELGKRYVPDVAMLGSVRATLRSLLDVLGPASSNPEFRTRHRSRHKRILAERRLVEDGQDLTIALASQIIDDVVPEDAIIVDEGIRSSRVLLRHLSVPPSRSYHRNTGGAIGWGLPAAIGASFGQPGRDVVLFVGDGSALMSIQALWTAAQHGCNVTVVVSNNRGYQAVQAAVEKHRDEPLGRPAVGAAIAGPDPDFISLAAGLGVDGVVVTTADELRRSLVSALGSPGPRVIEMRLGPDELVGAAI